ncbi:AAA family ATPase [Polyangium sp. y55x31]|uniref:AAA family ATPase n=1 Tax=Polyangium sp. y55x31 TaxID=3042688 RepID=UPI0024828FB4|nr:AAA family ATPase [Polyangium sp. y55x31]MDI1478657.1 AAA family ATPase [Polyangium sp. y55x31]
MWRRVELRNYRSIEHVKVDLAPFTLLVGPNGSGKSNFADALAFVRDVAFDAVTAVERRGGIGELRRWRPTKPTDISVDIRSAASEPALESTYVRHYFKIHSGREGRWSFSREIVEVVRDGDGVFNVVRERGRISLHTESALDRLTELASAAASRALSDMSSAMVLARQFRAMKSHAGLREVRRIRLTPDAMRLPQPATENTRLDETGSNVAAAYRSLKADAQEDVLAAMQKIVPGLSGIYVENFDRFLLLKFAQRQGDEQATFSAAAMSEGTLRALGILIAAEQMTKDELLIIEEPEVAIHVGAAQLLFDVLKRASERGAVLVTTHSADLLDAAKDEEILVCAYRDGVTKIGPLASEQRAVVKEGLFSVAELMRSEPLRIEGEPIPAVEP